MPRIRRTALIALLGFLVLVPPVPPAAAQDEPAVITGLRGEPATLFDLGMKRLRELVNEAARRLATPADPLPRVGVFYKPETKTIEVIFEFRQSTTDPAEFTEAACLSRNRRTVNEVFRIDRLVTVLNLTYAEKVRRRLGMLFTHEPTEQTNDSVAMGQRLAELTYVTVRLVSTKGSNRTTCRRLIVSRLSKDIGDN